MWVGVYWLGRFKGGLSSLGNGRSEEGVCGLEVLEVLDSFYLVFFYRWKFFRFCSVCI